ncbi:hypothetical protein NM74_04865 [Aeromonas hydrophila]|uniref:hypothetical protein n=1 Tax=Aeromonas hydrophila TaxID=644 RepID=UPI0005390A22|nr:hypothetical protein [Aeromonas hydrophila]KHA57697.1 hypothetical protein NM74_04865 [Aeromonas hydrophila]
MSLMTRTFIGWLFFMVAGVVSAAPKIQLDDLIEIIESDRSTLQKKIYNFGDMTAYVMTEVREVAFDDKGGEQTMAPSGVRESGLHVSPPRFIIPPKGFKTDRVLYVGPRDKERYFRVRFYPVQPDEQDGFGLSQKEAKNYKEKITRSGFELLYGYGVLYVLKPAVSFYKTQITTGQDKICIVNGGNSTILLRGVMECQIGTKDCGVPTDLYITPGITKSLPVKRGFQYQFSLHEGGRVTKKELPE